MAAKRNRHHVEEEKTRQSPDFFSLTAIRESTPATIKALCIR
jgi:hypothetical protein